MIGAATSKKSRYFFGSAMIRSRIDAASQTAGVGSGIAAARGPVERDDEGPSTPICLAFGS